MKIRILIVLKIIPLIVNNEQHLVLYFQMVTNLLRSIVNPFG